jgi:hypothetical protein
MRRVTVVSILAVLIAGCLAAPVGAKVLATTYSGRNPYFGWALAAVERPHHLHYKVTSRKAGPLQLVIRLRCRHGKGYRTRLERKFTAKPPIRRRIPLSNRPRICIYGVTANHKGEDSGWIAVTLDGQARRFKGTDTRGTYRSGP